MKFVYLKRKVKVKIKFHLVSSLFMKYISSNGNIENDCGKFANAVTNIIVVVTKEAIDDAVGVVPPVTTHC